MNKESEGFAHFRQKFPKISEAKVKGGIFFCPQITQLFKDRDFSRKWNLTERRAWKAFENICSNFTDIEKEENYNEILQQLILSYSALGCNMSLKLHCLHSYSDFFMKTWEPAMRNMVTYSIRIFPKLQSGTVEKESKYAGWVLPESCMGDINRRK
jgi:hypothetical protein